MPSTASIELFPAVADFLEQRKKEFDQIATDRRESLQSVADYVNTRLKNAKLARLVFICTHNSRRSQFSQVWAQIAADVYGHHVLTFSGGTEGTAFNPRTVSALRRAGVSMETDNMKSSNPIYVVRHATRAPMQTCFSKAYPSAPNPTTEYCAVMTCSNADAACPVVVGSDARIAVMYDDPKVSDDTPAESATYDTRSQQICREMLYLMSRVDIRS